MKSILFSFLFSLSSLAESVTLTWDKNPEEEDIKGYKICQWHDVYGINIIDGKVEINKSPSLNTLHDVGNVCTNKIEGLVKGVQYHFTVLAYNEAGESEPSNKLDFMIPLSSPSNLAILIEHTDDPNSGVWTNKASFNISEIETTGFYRAKLALQD